MKPCRAEIPAHFKTDEKKILLKSGFYFVGVLPSLLVLFWLTVLFDAAWLHLAV